MSHCVEVATCSTRYGFELKKTIITNDIPFKASMCTPSIKFPRLIVFKLRLHWSPRRNHKMKNFNRSRLSLTLSLTINLKRTKISANFQGLISARHETACASEIYSSVLVAIAQTISCGLFLRRRLHFFQLSIQTS